MKETSSLDHEVIETGVIMDDNHITHATWVCQYMWFLAANTARSGFMVTFALSYGICLFD